MFSKKIALSLLLFFASKIHASEPLIGQITNNQVKNFLTGFAIGATHGAVNRIIEGNYTENDAPWFAYLATFIAANEFHYAYNGRNVSFASSLWGRGIGQFLAESIDNNKKLNIRLNLALISAILSGNGSK